MVPPSVPSSLGKGHQGSSSSVNSTVAQNSVFNANNPPVATNPLLLSPGAPTPLAVPSGVAVGRTAGSFAVSPTGAATYSIPLWKPPGIAGLSPSLSLSYSSSQG